MALPEEIDCINCKVTTSNYYIIKTNKGDLFRCKACYEANFMRNQRDEYSKLQRHSTAGKEDPNDKNKQDLNSL